MVAVRIETYDFAVHRRRFIGQHGPLTSGSGQTSNLGAEYTTTTIMTTEDAVTPTENSAVALRPMPLSLEAAADMERMLNDPTVPAHAGEPLRTISAEELLRRLGR